MSATPLADLIRIQRDHVREREAANPGFDPTPLAMPKVDLVMGVGYPERVDIAKRAIEQILVESQNPEYGASVRNVTLVNFGLDTSTIGGFERCLARWYSHGLIDGYAVQTTERHSPARSFNVGVNYLAAEHGTADFTAKLDDDSRFAPNAFGRLIKTANERGLSIVSPRFVRREGSEDYANDAEFAALCAQYPGSDEVLPPPKFMTADGCFDFSRLMMGLCCSGATAPTPATPNENGMVFSRRLVEDLVHSPIGGVFTEANGSSEGFRLFAALAGTHHAARIGVLKQPVFDRGTSDPMIPLNWGLSDAEMCAALLELDLLPKGISFAGMDSQGGIYGGHVDADRPRMIRDIEHLDWYSAELARARYNGLLEKIPDQFKDFIPALADELAQTVAVIEANKSSLTREYYGKLSPDSMFVGLTETRLIGGTLHMLGSFVRSREMGVPMSVFHNW
jgi:hypothetical protein